MIPDDELFELEFLACHRPQQCNVQDTALREFDDFGRDQAWAESSLSLRPNSAHTLSNTTAMLRIASGSKAAR